MPPTSTLLPFGVLDPMPERSTGMIFVLFSIGVAAAEAAVGLALILAVYRHTKTTDLSQLTGRPQ